MSRCGNVEALFWSIALPGFGQLLKGDYTKGIVLLTLEFLVNVHSHLNEIIILSFQGDVQTAIQRTNYQWLMFYPCLYMFGIWDAYKEAGANSLSFLPFALSAFFATVGIIYSPTLRLFGILFGPVWLAMLFCFVGLGVGWLIKKWIELNQS